MRFAQGSPLAGIPTAVKNLLIINGIMFLLKMTGSFRFGVLNMDDLLGLHFYASPLFRPWQLLTYMFMHGSIGHIFMNMFGLVMLGAPLEYRWGSKRFLEYYLITGLGAGIIYMATMVPDYRQALANVQPSDLADVKQYVRETAHTGLVFRDMWLAKLQLMFVSPMVGASGALFGVMLAFGMLYPNVELIIFPYPIPIKAKYFVMLYGAYEVYQSYAARAGDNVAHFAHLGGLLVGFIVLMIWRRKLSDL